jgi:hypothetical protein
LIAVSATRPPTAPRPDDAERAPGKLEAGELLLGVLEALFEVGAFEPLDVSDRRNDVARDGKHRGEHQLLDGVGVGAGGVEDGDAAPGHGLHGDVVHASAGARDCLDRRRHIVGLEHVRAQQDRVRRRKALADDVERMRKALEAARGDVVVDGDAMLGHECFARNSSM